MDTNAIKRLESLIKEIKTSLLMNEKIRKLLYAESDDSGIIPEVDIVKDHIFTQPIIDVDTKPPFDKMNYITITMPSGGKQGDTAMGYIIKVSIQSERSCWSCVENGNERIRPLYIVQEILNTIDGEKFCMSGPLQFTDMVETRTNHLVYGYSLMFVITDGDGESASTK